MKRVAPFSAAILSLALLPRLVETASRHGGHPRIVQVASDVHYWSSFAKGVLDSPNMFEKLSDKAYCTSSEMRGRYYLSKREPAFPWAWRGGMLICYLPK